MSHRTTGGTYKPNIVLVRNYNKTIKMKRFFVVFVLRLEDCSFLIAPLGVSNLYMPITFNLPNYCLYRTSQSVPMITSVKYLTICLIQTLVYSQQCCFKCVRFQHGKTIGDHIEDRIEN
jgi:hypothetical protein